MKYSIALPGGWKMSLVGIKDPVEAYETMTNVAKAAMRQVMRGSGWLTTSIRFLPLSRGDI